MNSVTEIGCWESLVLDLAEAGDYSKLYIYFDSNLQKLLEADFRTISESIGIEHELIPVDCLSVDIGLAKDIARHLRLTSKNSICVAIGGGSVLDLLKISVAEYRHNRVINTIESLSRRSGYVRLPQSIRTQPSSKDHLVLVPSTIGTGSEVSAVACTRTAGAHDIVSGDVLVCDWVVYDSRLTRSLDLRKRVEGIFEMMLRVIGPYVGRSNRGSIESIEQMLVRIVKLGDILSNPSLTMDVTSVLEASLLSADTHKLLADAVDPFSVRHWYIANEISFVTGLTKIPATLLILPQLWRRICEGDVRYGSREHLLSVWQVIQKHSSFPLDDDPVCGLEELTTVWGLRTSSFDLTNDQISIISERCVTRWGGRLPMLAGIEDHEIRRLLRSVDCEDQVSS